MDIHNQENAFIQACCQGDLDEAKLLLDAYPTISNSMDIIRDTFRDACMYNQLHVAKWMANRYAHVTNSANCPYAYIISYLCRCGSLDVIEWLLSINPNTDVHEYEDGIFDACCSSGNLYIAQWFTDNYDINVHAYDHKAFIHACNNNHLHVVEWLYSFGKIHDDAVFKAFIYACHHSHMKVVKWLSSRYDVDVHADNEMAFRASCSNNKLDVDKECFILMDWLLCRYPDIDVHANGDDAFNRLCINGDYDLAQWLLEKYPSISLKGALVPACLSANLKLVTWLTTLHDYDDTEYVAAFERTFMSGILNAVQWLAVKYPDVVTKADHVKLTKKACIQGHLDVVEFLHQYYGLDIGENYNDIFVSCGDMAILLWLYQNFPVNVHYGNHHIFEFAITTGNYELLQWLTEITVYDDTVYYLDGTSAFMITMSPYSSFWMRFVRKYEGYRIYSNESRDCTKVIEHMNMRQKKLMSKSART